MGKENVCLGWRKVLPAFHFHSCSLSLSRIYLFIPSSGMYRFFDLTVKLKPKGDRPDIMGVVNATLYRLMQTAADKRIKRRCRLKWPHVGLPVACMCEADRDIFPVDSLFRVWQHLLYGSASDATCSKKGSGGEHKEKKIRVRIISTGLEKREWIMTGWKNSKLHWVRHTQFNQCDASFEGDRTTREDSILII